MPREEMEILLVEDDPEDVQLTLHTLHNEKLINRIQVVRDGEEALDFLFHRGAYDNQDRSSHPRLILLDLKLPKVDGLEVLRQVKQDPRTRVIPVVILTASKQEQDVVASYQLGVNSYIQKPMDFDQFRATIRQLGYYWLLVNQPPPVPALKAA